MEVERVDVAIIGGGPAGLMAAERLAAAGHAVVVFDRMPSVGRKFLMAGRSGLNLTHSEAIEAFIARYGSAAPQLMPAIRAFSPDALRRWCEDLGQPTFVGSSGRVFPVAMKASPLLRAWLRRLSQQGVSFRLRHEWRGWSADGELLFDTVSGPTAVHSAATILALGGASWPRLGSDGGWSGILSSDGIAVAPFRPANCGFRVTWTEHFRSRFEGMPLKSIALRCGDMTSRGEIVITKDGIEGGGVYAVSAALRDEIERTGSGTLHVCLTPDIARTAVLERLAGRPSKQTLSGHLRKSLGLSPAAVGLLQEAALASGRPLTDLPVEAVAGLVLDCPVRATATAPIARAISTAGGIALAEFDAHFMLRRRPGVFACGEMLDWEAPTGGYLLQACFASGRWAGEGAITWLAAKT